MFHPGGDESRRHLLAVIPFEAQGNSAVARKFTRGGNQFNGQPVFLQDFFRAQG